MSDVVTVQLGDFTFMNMEVPSKIPLGGDQILAVRKLVGGTRIIDALGPDPVDLEWSGWFMGKSAIARARYLDTLRVKGKPLLLKWSSYSFNVVILSFHYEYEFEYRLPYSIKCVIVSDNNNQTNTLTSTQDWDAGIQDATQSVDNSINSLQEVTIPIPNTTIKYSTDRFADLKKKWAALKANIQKVQSFLKKTSQEINSIRDQIKDAQAEVTRQMAAATNSLQNITTLGGVFPNNPIAKNVKSMSNVMVNANNQVQLDNIHNLLTKTDKNLAAIQPASSSATSTTAVAKSSTIVLPITVTVQSTNLYALASQYYGNAMKWTLIANANNLSSPYVTSSLTLTIPKDTISTGGNL